MTHRVLTALPVYNEEKHLATVLPEVAESAGDLLVVNDGSRDGTAAVLAKLARQIDRLHVEHHVSNQGYGAALRTAFVYCRRHGYDGLVTIDCDGQHQPRLIPTLIEELFKTTADGRPIDLVSGSRYLEVFPGNSAPPVERRKINLQITALINEALGLSLTDGFCGFKAYRNSALGAFNITEVGYAMPLQHWVQAKAAGLNIAEYAVPLVYLEEERSFGGSLDNADRRLRYYLDVLTRELKAHNLPLPPSLENFTESPACRP